MVIWHSDPRDLEEFARSRYIHHPPKLITGRRRRGENQGLVPRVVAVQGCAKLEGAIQSCGLLQIQNPQRQQQKIFKQKRLEKYEE